jgi:hypothetical protein
MRCKSLLASACLLLTLTACAGSGTVRSPSLAPIPADLKVCFNRTVPAPPPGPLSRKQVVDLIAKLKQSEAAKTYCGRRLIGWYETQAKEYVN